MREVCKGICGALENKGIPHEQCFFDNLNCTIDKACTEKIYLKRVFKVLETNESVIPHKCTPLHIYILVFVYIEYKHRNGNKKALQNFICKNSLHLECQQQLK